MERNIIQLLGSLGVVAGMVVFFSALLLGFTWPLMAFFALRHLKHIRLEFEKLNETLGSKVTITKSGPLGI